MPWKTPSTLQTSFLQPFDANATIHFEFVKSPSQMSVVEIEKRFTVSTWEWLAHGHQIQEKLGKPGKLLLPWCIRCRWSLASSRWTGPRRRRGRRSRTRSGTRTRRRRQGTEWEYRREKRTIGKKSFEKRAKSFQHLPWTKDLKAPAAWSPGRRSSHEAWNGEIQIKKFALLVYSIFLFGNVRITLRSLRSGISAPSPLAHDRRRRVRPGSCQGRAFGLGSKRSNWQNARDNQWRH